MFLLKKKMDLSKSNAGKENSNIYAIFWIKNERLLERMKQRKKKECEIETNKNGDKIIE